MNFVRDKGYVETKFGRRRFLADINSTDKKKRAEAERKAINTTIQGTAADILKYSILKMETNLQESMFASDDIQFVLHVHDELFYEVPSEKADEVATILKSSMEKCAEPWITLKVEVKKGQSWGSMKRIE